MILGIDALLKNKSLCGQLFGFRVALLGHPASTNSKGYHTLDLLKQLDGINMTAAFGPQHGMRGDKQDNMIESDDYIDARYNIPVFSLYGKLRKPTKDMMDNFDILLVDLQDIGTRIYTFITTLAYMLEECSKCKKSVWILDRPNPAGRPIEGTILQPGWESFVGIGPIIMRHGLTLAEFAKWYVDKIKMDIELKIVPMENYFPDESPGYGWPMNELSWINPSPNAASVFMARCYPGTVLFEGTTLSEGRGTTKPLEMFGAPDININKVLMRMKSLQAHWLKGCFIRPCYFEPTFHKHAGKVNAGIQIHTDNPSYLHSVFKPYRLCALFLKAVRLEYPSYNLWKSGPYEYEYDRLAIDLLSGSDFLRKWVDDDKSRPFDFEIVLSQDEQKWQDLRRPYLLY